MRRLTPLLIEEQQANNGGFTHVAVIEADDLTTTTANTAQDITLGTVPKGWIINKTMARLVTPFKDVSDAAYNSTTLIVGDAGSSNRYITSAQLNENGTEITIPQYNNTAYQVTADTAIVAEFGSQSGKSLRNIDKGEVHIFFQLIDTRVLSDLAGNQPILTK
jgi:hypothetical protein